jgi:V/A-type H+-transporting ATPase subunit K
MIRKMLLVVFALCLSGAVLAFAEESPASASTPSASASAEQSSGVGPWKYISAALAVGIACIAGGIAVGQIGAAAMGAMSENPELAGKALPYVGLAEGICLWGFLVGLFILLL